MTTLNAETLSVLKNFASIQSNFVIHPNAPLKTMSDSKTILAQSNAILDTSLEEPVGIYDLNELLSVLSMFSEPELTFTDSGYIMIKQDKQSVRYYLANTSILTYPEKDVKMPPVDVSFDLTTDLFSSLKKASSALKAPEMTVSNHPDGLEISVTNSRDKTSNSFSVVLDENIESPDTDFEYTFTIANLKLYPCDYRVNVSGKGIAHFVSDTVNYWIPLNK